MSSDIVESPKNHFTRSRGNSDNVQMSTCIQPASRNNRNRKNHGGILLLDGSSQTDPLQNPVLNEELKLLKLENCTLRNKYDDLRLEANNSKQTLEENLKKIELMNKQLECVNEIMESNEKLKKENDSLREKYEAANLEKHEMLQSQVENLQEKMKEFDRISVENGVLQEEVEKLKNDLKVADLTVEGLKEVMSKLSDVESVHDEGSAKSDPIGQVRPRSSDYNHSNQTKKYNTAGKRFNPYRRVNSDIRFDNNQTWDNKKNVDSTKRVKFNNKGRFQRSQTFYNSQFNR